jgi:hypothetical protein
MTRSVILCDGAFDYSGDGIHRTDNFRLELWWNVELDLAKRYSEAPKPPTTRTFYDDQLSHRQGQGFNLPVTLCFVLEWQ